MSHKIGTWRTSSKVWRSCRQQSKDEFYSVVNEEPHLKQEEYQDQEDNNLHECLYGKCSTSTKYSHCIHPVHRKILDM